MRRIPSFPDYEAAEDGAVFRKGRPLKPSPNGKGYMRVFLRRGGKTHTCYVHRLICEAFSRAPEAGEEARHLNGVRHDIPEKLAAAAISGRRWGRLPGAIEPKSTQRRLSPDDVKRIRDLSGTMPQRQIGEIFGISRGAVQQVIYGQSYRHVR